MDNHDNGCISLKFKLPVSITCPMLCDMLTHTNFENINHLTSTGITYYFEIKKKRTTRKLHLENRRSSNKLNDNHFKFFYLFDIIGDLGYETNFVRFSEWRNIWTLLKTNLDIEITNVPWKKDLLQEIKTFMGDDVKLTESVDDPNMPHDSKYFLLRLFAIPLRNPTASTISIFEIAYIGGIIRGYFGRDNDPYVRATFSTFHDYNLGTIMKYLTNKNLEKINNTISIMKFDHILSKINDIQQTKFVK